MSLLRLLIVILKVVMVDERFDKHRAVYEVHGGDGMKDLISRQAAIDAIVNSPSRVQDENMPLTDQYDGATFRQIEILGIIDTLPSIESWDIVKSTLNELERKEKKLYFDYCDTAARLKAINKIAESNQTPKRKLEGIRPLAEQE